MKFPIKFFPAIALAMALSPFAAGPGPGRRSAGS